MGNFKDDAVVHFNDGNQLYKVNLYKEALEQYSKAVEKDPVFYDAHFCIAKTYLRQGEFQKGIEYFKKYIHLIPKQIQSHYYLGLANILNSQNKNIEALYLIENTEITIADDKIFDFASILLSNNRYFETIHLILNSKNKNTALENYYKLLENENLPNNEISRLKNENIIPAFYEQVNFVNELTNSKIQNKEVEQKTAEAKEILKDIRNTHLPNYQNRLNEVESKTEDSKDIIYEIFKKTVKENPTSPDSLKYFNSLKALDYDSEKLNPFAKIIKQEQDKKQSKLISIVSISVISLILIIGTIYYAFIKDYPENDAQKLAVEFCECYNKNNHEKTKLFNSFLSNFISFKFIKQSEARKSLQDKTDAVNSNLHNCLQTVEAKAGNLKSEYNYENRNIFDIAFQNNQNNCSNLQNQEVASLYQKIGEKINSIQDPEPDITKIKEDLIGKKITGWSFDYLSEFKEAKIINQTKGLERIEYNLYFKLFDEKQNSEHEAEIKAVYKKGYDGWYLENTKMVYITYINEAPLQNWKAIEPLNNCTYQIISFGRYWIKDGSWGMTYKGGGSDADQFHLNSSKIYIKSREEYPVNLTFKYKANL
jgi:hypothetical protein